MTANELVDELDNANFDNAMYLCDQAATMLRQQQAEIEQLKALAISLSPNANLIYTRGDK